MAEKTISRVNTVLYEKIIFQVMNWPSKARWTLGNFRPSQTKDKHRDIFGLRSKTVVLHCRGGHKHNLQ